MTPERRQRDIQRFLLSTLFRWLPIIAAAAIGAGIVAYVAVGENTQPATARQAMALRGVDWADLTSTHEGNEAWLEANQAAVLGSEAVTEIRLWVEKPASLQTSSFAIVAEAPTDETALAALNAAVAALSGQGVSFASDTDQLAELEEELAAAQANAASSAEQAAAVRAQRDSLLETGPQSQIDQLFQDAQVLDDERQRWASRATELQFRIDDLQLQRSYYNERIGDPEVEQPSAATSGRLAGAATGVMVGLLTLFALLFSTRQRGRITSSGLLSLIVADTPTLNLAAGKSADLSGIDEAQLVHLRKILNDSVQEEDVVSFVDVTERAGAQALMYIVGRDLASRNVNVAVAETLPELAQVARSKPLPGRNMIFTYPAPGEPEERVIASTDHAVAVVALGVTRSNQLKAKLERLAELGVNLLTVVMAPSEALYDRAETRPPSSSTSKVPPVVSGGGSILAPIR